MIGQLIQHFKILEKLGQGGMGEVYVAEDTRLHRRVAVKFLPPQYSTDPEFKARFEHEATAAAALNHPNIVTVYELGEHEGRLFIVLELVEGQSLEQMIESGDVKITKAVNVSIQVCEGLGAAHEAGIVHRDVKPANILVDRSGRVKILDFGLAKSRRATTETKAGTTVGTIQYESPEQGRGDQVDQRSDLFSLGVVLYELITGRRPFTGEFSDAIRYAIANEQPEPLARYKADVPDDLQRIVSKLLEKDPDLRYQTASGVLSDLKLLQRSSGPSSVHSAYHSAVRPPVLPPTRKWRKVIIPVFAMLMAVVLFVFRPWKVELKPAGEAEAAPDRLAVMYFDNLTDPDDAQRQGEVISSLIISDLSESQQMQVVSTQRLYDLLKNLGREGTRKITPDVATEVARKANARWMLTGRILSAEPNWVVSAELSDVTTGDLLASPSVAGASGERIFEVVDRLTSEIKAHMALPKGSLADVDKPVIELTTESSDALRLYLEGKELVNRFFMPEAEAKFREALTYDSTFAMAYYGIAGCRVAYWQDYQGSREAAMSALRHVEHTSERDSHMIRGLAALVQARPEEGASQYQEVVNKDPDDKEAWDALGRLYQFIAPVRDYKRAIEMYSRVIEIDPRYKIGYNSLAYAYDAVGDLERSLWAIDKYIELAPEEPNPYDSRAELLARNGRLSEALDSYLQALKVKPDYLPSLKGAIGLYRHQGDYPNAEKLALTLVNHPLLELQSSGRFEQGLISVQQGKVKEALRQAAECIDFFKSKAELERKIADVYGARSYLKTFLNDEAGARSELNKAENEVSKFLKPEEENIWFIVGKADLYARFGHPGQADSVLEKISQSIGQPLAPDSASYWRLLGRSRFYRGDFDSAVVYMERGKGDLPGFNQLTWLGRAYAGRRQLRDAVGYLERASGLLDTERRGNVTSSVMVHFWLAEVYEKSGRTQDAVREYRTFLDIWKDADAGIQEITDAKSRLAALGA